MIDTSKIYDTKNNGKLRITKYTNSKSVEVEFVDTGYKTTTEAGKIREGFVKDPLKRSVYGVGFIGAGSHKSKTEGVSSKKYSIWHSLIGRCYDLLTQKKHPSYVGCSVCEEWHNYQNFAKWFDENYIEGYHLDKDIKIDGNRIYSPATCLFVSRKDNQIKAMAKNFLFVSPQGKVVSVYNLNEFCISAGLNQSPMSKVHLGKVNSHKGWKKAQ